MRVVPGPTAPELTAITATTAPMPAITKRRNLLPQNCLPAQPAGGRADRCRAVVASAVVSSPSPSKAERHAKAASERTCHRPREAGPASPRNMPGPPGDRRNHRARHGARVIHATDSARRGWTPKPGRPRPRPRPRVPAGPGPAPNAAASSRRATRKNSASVARVQEHVERGDSPAGSSRRRRS